MSTSEIIWRTLPGQRFGPRTESWRSTVASSERTTCATRLLRRPASRAPITAGGARRHGGRGDHAGAGDGESGSTSAARATEARDSRVITKRSDLG